MFPSCPSVRADRNLGERNRLERGRITPLRNAGALNMRSVSSSRAGGGTMKPEASGANTKLWPASAPGT
jgi:hypothetical protein